MKFIIPFTNELAISALSEHREELTKSILEYDSSLSTESVQKVLSSIDSLMQKWSIDNKTVNIECNLSTGTVMILPNYDKI